MSQSRENTLRRLLGLGPAPDPTGMRLRERQGRRLIEFVSDR